MIVKEFESFHFFKKSSMTLSCSLFWKFRQNELRANARGEDELDRKFRSYFLLFVAVERVSSSGHFQFFFVLYSSSIIIAILMFDSKEKKEFLKRLNKSGKTKTNLMILFFLNSKTNNKTKTKQKQSLILFTIRAATKNLTNFPANRINKKSTISNQIKQVP